MGKQQYLRSRYIGVIKQTIVIRMESSLEMRAVLAMFSKYIEPDGMALLEDHKKLKYDFYK